ncbi:MAG TPA: protein-export chaperone SecB [Candidatus Ligilactobacillus excrementipullorum]|nr:protein-export chaperone SecB [Candidatus Ligilactobacillus excrementipullorum]
MDTENNKSIIQFTNPELIETIFLVNSTFSRKDNKNQNLQIEPAIENPHDTDDDQRETSISLSISNFKELKFDDNTPFLIRITVKANFKWQKGLEDDEEENLLKVNASSLLLSYIRPLVSQLTGMSRFNTQSIPFIDFTANIE